MIFFVCSSVSSVNNAAPARAVINPNIPDEEDQKPQDGQDDAGDPPTIEDACQLFKLPASCVNLNQAVTVIVKTTDNKYYLQVEPLVDNKYLIEFIQTMTGVDAQRIQKLTSQKGID